VKWNNAIEECAKLILQKGFDLSGPMDQGTIFQDLTSATPHVSFVLPCSEILAADSR
jgi:hypothetical protein